jgi:DNA helicase-2/ATP-dependent DNA helicase PcrA
VRHLQLSVAGGRKTQSIVEACEDAPPGRRLLLLTYTLTNQDALRSRVSALGPLSATVEVRGWLSFLMGHWVQPYLPLYLEGRRLGGLNFKGEPHQKASGHVRFLDAESRAYRRHLARLAVEVCEASSGAVIARLARIYDEIHIDEVQDLNGYDLEILKVLLDAPLDVSMVGDVRQALLSTNAREQKNSKYKGIKIKEWFEEQEHAGRVAVTHSTRTWRCNQQLADFADTIFDETFGFPPTESQNTTETEHDGVFVVATEDAAKYVETFKALCLRHGAGTARGVDLPFVNIGVSKGMDVERVLVWPTGGATEFLRDGKMLEGLAACSLYVAVTRARASIAFVVERPEDFRFPVWRPAK